MRKRTRNTLLITICVVLCASTAAVVCMMMNTDRQTVCASVDGAKVTSEEMIFYLTAERASCVQYFTEKYGVQTVDSAFWTAGYDGETPSGYLAEHALEQLRYDRALFADCEKQGLCEKTDFSSLSADMKKENEQRAQSLQKGEPVYGVTEYSLSSYLDYVKSNLIVRHRELLKKNKILTADETAIRMYYDEIRDSDPLFVNEDGTYKNYADVHAKVSYLYNEKQYDDYIRNLMEQQKVKRNDDALIQLIEREENA